MLFIDLVCHEKWKTVRDFFYSVAEWTKIENEFHNKVSNAFGKYEILRQHK